MRDETKANLTSGNTWSRLVHMIVLILAFNIAELVNFIVAEPGTCF